MNTGSFTLSEWMAWSLNAVLCLGLTIWCYSKRSKEQFWAPPLFMAAIYAYYIVVGPWMMIRFGNSYDRNVDMRPFYIPAWIGAAVALVSWLLGYAIHGKRSRGRRSVSGEVNAVTPGDLWRLGVTLSVIGIVGFVIVEGVGGLALINPFKVRDEYSSGGYTGAFANYLSLSMNLLVPGCAAVFLSSLMRGGRGNAAIVWVVLATGIFVSQGFRYRLVLLYGAMTFVYYLYRRKRPNLLLVMAAVTIFVMAMGFIGNTRNYGRGLDVSRNEASVFELLLGAFGETGILASSGAVLEVVPEQRPFVWFEPIKQAILMPIPSAIFPTKNTSAYMIDTLITIYGEKDYLGGAYMLFAECYQAFWWPGVILAFVGFGWASRYIWEWYLMRRYNPLALIVYASAISYLYVTFSRGYLPQIVMLFVFSVGPSIALYHWPHHLLRFLPGGAGPRPPRPPRPPRGSGQPPPPMRRPRVAGGVTQ